MPGIQDITSLVGNTPLLKLRMVSELTGCDIYGKAEFMNPGQSIKDRAALFMLQDGAKSGRLEPGGLVVEGTAGNTGIGLAVMGNALGYRTVVVMPDTQSDEKKSAVTMLGAELIEVPAAPYSSPEHYVHVSSRIAEQRGAMWANQFDNLANRQAHIEGTGPEIWEQTNGKVSGFVCAAGTGATIAGTAIALKERNRDIMIGLADPAGAALHSWYSRGVLCSSGSSISEGIGQGRVTGNLVDAPIDVSWQIEDAEALPYIFDLIQHEGICVGISSGINIAGAVRLARNLGPGHTIVTVLCDYGNRYAGKLFDAEFLRSRNLPVPPWISSHGNSLTQSRQR